MSRAPDERKGHDDDDADDGRGYERPRVDRSRRDARLRMAPGGPGRARHPAPVETQAGDGTYQGAPRSGPHARATRGRRLHEPVPLRAPLPAQHRSAAAPVRGAHADRARPHAARRPGAVHRADLTSGGVPDREPFLHGVPPRHRRHAASVPGPASPPGVREMSTIEAVMSRSDFRAMSTPRLLAAPRGRSGHGPGGAPPPARRGSRRGTRGRLRQSRLPAGGPHHGQ